MGEQTKISWCDATFNPWIGCEPVSAGCANCYAAAQVHRWGKDFSKRERTSASNWKKPLAWNRKPWVCDDCGFALASDPVLCRCGGQRFRRRRVFCGSMCDWLDRKVNPLWRLGLLHLIWSAPNLRWLMLSKRIEHWRELVNQCWSRSSDSLQSRADFSGKLPEYDADEFRKWLQRWLEQDTPPANVWIGTTVENQKAADQRIPALLRIPAAKRFLSVEPMLGPVDLFNAMPCGYFCSEDHGHVDHQTLNGLSWLVIGGESGRNARACHVDWIRSLVRQGKSAGVPVFTKQLGSNTSFEREEEFPNAFRSDCGLLTHPKGADPSEWPADLCVREWPKE